jgi:hypothetical protein
MQGTPEGRRQRRHNDIPIHISVAHRPNDGVRLGPFKRPFPTEGGLNVHTREQKAKPESEGRSSPQMSQGCQDASSVAVPCVHTAHTWNLSHLDPKVSLDVQRDRVVAHGWLNSQRFLKLSSPRD